MTDKTNLSRRQILGGAASSAAALALAAVARGATFGNPDSHPTGRINGRSPTSLDEPGPQNPVLAGQFPSFQDPPATDVGGMDLFWASFNNAHKRYQDGGWAREVTQLDFAISEDIAGVNMRLAENAIRELHWHQQAELEAGRESWTNRQQSLTITIFPALSSATLARIIVIILVPVARSAPSSATWAAAVSRRENSTPSRSAALFACLPDCSAMRPRRRDGSKPSLPTPPWLVQLHCLVPFPTSRFRGKFWLASKKCLSKTHPEHPRKKPLRPAPTYVSRNRRNFQIIVLLQGLCGSFADDYAGRHRVAGRHTRENGGICYAQSLHAVDLQIAVNYRHGVATHLCGATLVPECDKSVTKEPLQVRRVKSARCDFPPCESSQSGGVADLSDPGQSGRKILQVLRITEVVRIDSHRICRARARKTNDATAVWPHADCHRPRGRRRIEPRCILGCEI
jgi:hypothetical protein